jgi:hypothetical protein
MEVHRRFRILSIKYQLRLSNFDIYCVHSFFATLSVECDLITFANVVDKTANVNKNFLLRGVVYYEAKSL